MKPKKRFSQNFLTDKNIAKKIVDALSVPADRQVTCLEIGAGKGILTEFLLAKNCQLYIVEIDREAVQILKKRFEQLKDRIFQTDILKFDLAKHFSYPLFVIGNLPYHITGPLFFKLLDNHELIEQAVVMVQKEVAERVIAKPGTKDYGILSVMLQSFFDTEYLFTVSEKVFYPKPKVLSAVIRLTKRKEPLPINDYRKFKQVVKTAFNKRRKTLRNALKDYYLIDDVPEDYLTKRAEQLSVEDFVKLTDLVK